MRLATLLIAAAAMATADADKCGTGTKQEYTDKKCETKSQTGTPLKTYDAAAVKILNKCTKGTGSKVHPRGP